MADEPTQPAAAPAPAAAEPAPTASAPTAEAVAPAAPVVPAPEAPVAPVAPLAAVVEEFGVDAKAARRAERAALREKARLEREGPPRKAFVVTKCFTADGSNILPGRPVLLTEEAATTFADHIRPATDLDLSAGPSPQAIG